MAALESAFGNVVAKRYFSHTSYNFSACFFLSEGNMPKKRAHH